MACILLASVAEVIVGVLHIARKTSSSLASLLIKVSFPEYFDVIEVHIGKITLSFVICTNVIVAVDEFALL